MASSRRVFGHHAVFAEVDFKKAFGKCQLRKVHEAVSRCSWRQNEADVFVLGHLDVQVHVELGGLDIAPFSRSLSLSNADIGVAPQWSPLWWKSFCGASGTKLLSERNPHPMHLVGDDNAYV